MSQPNQPSATVELMRQLHQLYTSAPSAAEQQTAMEVAQLLMMQASSTRDDEELPSDG